MDYNPEESGQPPISGKLVLPEQSQTGNPGPVNELRTQIYDPQYPFAYAPPQDLPYNQFGEPLPPPSLDQQASAETQYHEANFGAPFSLADNRFINQQKAQRGPFGKMKALWQKDPAYKVLFTSIAAVILAASIFIGIGFAVFMPQSSHQSSNGPQNASGANGLSSAVRKSTPAPPQPTAQPTLAVPTPTATPMPTQVPPTPTPTQVTPTPVPTQVPQSTTQITQFPQQVSNGGRATVVVHTLPGATVTLNVVYIVPASPANVSPTQTGSDGYASFTWRVRVFSITGGATATVTATVTDQDGNQTTSAPVQIAIN
ncbi:MAG TPA: hypothetical protein VFN23_10045 [Ktedonobacteraceae bacterium]|nr:hypothetical protein [Ktedonobacteraceae bacterium]